MAFVAFLDACVLYPPTIRDLLLTVAEAGICQIRWSPDVLDEMERNVAARSKVDSKTTAVEGAKYLRRTMEDAFPDAMVERAAYENLIQPMTNDPKDRHVLAAAISGRANVLVTWNGKHFPQTAGAPYGIDGQDPDAYLLFQFELAPDSFLESLKFLSKQRHAPMDSVVGILTILTKTVPRFARAAKIAWQNRQSGPPPATAR